MFDYAKVDEAISRIVDATDPRMIVVFGSVSRHEAEDGSDLDLLVVFDEVESERSLCDHSKTVRRPGVAVRPGRHELRRLPTVQGQQVLVHT